MSEPQPSDTICFLIELEGITVDEGAEEEDDDIVVVGEADGRSAVLLMNCSVKLSRVLVRRYEPTENVALAGNSTSTPLRSEACQLHSI